MKFLAVLGAVFIAQSAFANEVGTHNPKIEATANTTVKLALAEKGAVSDWTEEPLTFQATSHQTAKLNDRVERMNEEVSLSLDELIAQKLEQALSK